MAALVRDRTRRRFHHNWEKAIAGLLRAARGRDRPAALYEAAKARYALYRWSADEADREKALRLAAQAGRLGAPEARTLALAIRREAGDDWPAPAHHRPGQRAPASASEEEESTDPALERVVNALEEAGDAPPSPDPGAGQARVSEVKAWSSPDYTRVAIYLSRWVGWQKLELPADAGHPRRLAVDLRPALLEGRTLERPVGGLRLSRVRAAQNEPDTVRVVLDLAGDDRVQVFRLDDPPRLVLDVGAARPVEPPPAVAVAEGDPAPAGARPPPRPLRLPRPPPGRRRRRPRPPTGPVPTHGWSCRRARWPCSRAGRDGRRSRVPRRPPSRPPRRTRRASGPSTGSWWTQGTGGTTPVPSARPGFARRT